MQCLEAMSACAVAGCSWEDEYDRYLGHIHKNIQNGSATDEEISQLRNLENIVALYDLMMKNHIEDCGSLSPAAVASKISKEKGKQAHYKE